MPRLTIRDLENLTGIKAHTIRMWEQRYQFLKPGRSETNIRYYCVDELMLLQDVALLNKAGFRISKINELKREELRRKVSRLEDAELQVENLANEMTGAMVDLDMERFQDIIDDYSSKKGIEKTINDLIYAFLIKSGLLWHSGHLHEASEQLASHIIRQKLIVAIELTVPKAHEENTILLFLPEGDHHEIGLLFSYYILKSHGFDTIYLGDNVPLEDLRHIVEEKKPAQIFMHLINTGKPFRLDRFLQQLSTKLPSTRIIISGKPAHPPKAWPSNVRAINEVQELFS